MDTKQFAEFVAVVVQALPRDLDPKTAQVWIENRSALEKSLRETLVPPYVLYQAPGQLDGGKALHQVRNGLRRSGWLSLRAFKIDDPLIESWLKNTTPYPDGLKDKVIFLLGIDHNAVEGDEVAYLEWRGGKMGLMIRFTTQAVFTDNDYVLLKPTL